jgi:hypothetical protein
MKNQILKYAACHMRERELEAKIKVLRDQMHALRQQRGGWHSSGFSGDATANWLTIQIDLADYLKQYANGNPVPKLCHFNYNEVIDGIEMRGVKQYFYYPPTFAGTLATKPLPTHVYATAQTDAIWAEGSLKPVNDPEPATEPATATT